VFLASDGELGSGLFLLVARHSTDRHKIREAVIQNPTE